MKRLGKKSHSRFFPASLAFFMQRSVKEPLAEQLYYSGLDFYYRHSLVGSRLDINQERGSMSW